MNDIPLNNLNFRKLLHYPNGPTVAFRPQSPTACNGFCVSCEKKGYLDGATYQLDQMSHGADTSDFEQLLGPLPGKPSAPRTVFLLESPGGYYKNGAPITFEGVTKQPPTQHYYWMSDLVNWPTDPKKVGGTYGPYFAYLLHAHSFHNAYFTNVVKCSLADTNAEQFVRFYVSSDREHRHAKIIRNCFEQFLSEELSAFQPKLVFYFGGLPAKMGYQLDLSGAFRDVVFTTLYHPAARMSGSRIVTENDRYISKAIERVTAAQV